MFKFFMQLSVLSGILLSSVAGADPMPETAIVGLFINPAYNQFSPAYVEVSQDTFGQLTMEMNVPCGTKNRPSSLQVYPTDKFRGGLKVVDRGEFQCAFGKAATYFLIGNKLEIRPTQPVSTPGFDGVYRFTRSK